MFKFFIKISIEKLFLKLRFINRDFRLFFLLKDKKKIQSKDCQIFYINLDHRVDRKLEVENEFRNLSIDNYTRISAVKNDNGALGCSMSHKLIYESSLSIDKLIWICEDDVTFLSSRIELDNLINNFYNDSRLDVLSIAYNALYKIKINNEFYITSNTQTMSCYILKPYVINDFIDMASKSIDGLRNDKPEIDYAIDMVWKKLQRKYIFALPVSNIAIQRPSFSDIRNRDVNYKL